MQTEVCSLLSQEESWSHAAWLLKHTMSLRHETHLPLGGCCCGHCYLTCLEIASTHIGGVCIHLGSSIGVSLHLRLPYDM